MGNHTPPLVFFSLASPKFVKKKKKKRQLKIEARGVASPQTCKFLIYCLQYIMHC